jgi:general secretion pathway protein A
MAADYLSFFYLNDDPFRLTPDIAYFYNSPAHATALLSLEYCVKQKEGFCVLTGEPGTGKTTILRIFTDKWKDRAEIALIMTPRLMPDEFFQAILDDFKIPRTTTNKNDMLKAFRDFLLSHAANDKRVVIIVDEAQELPDTTLEELRLLSNLETEKEKLLQIMLIGQHELCDKLLSAPLRQLNQRITVRVQLKPLTSPETSDYINTRLIRGGNNSLLFNQKAKDLVYELSGGIPRTINLLASRALMSAFLGNSREVKATHVEQGASDVMEAAAPREATVKPPASHRRELQPFSGRSSGLFAMSFSPRRVIVMLIWLLLIAAIGVGTLIIREKWDLLTAMVLPSPTPQLKMAPLSSARMLNRSTAKPTATVYASTSSARFSRSTSASTGKKTITVTPQKESSFAADAARETAAADPRRMAVSAFNAILAAWNYPAVEKTELAKGTLTSYLVSLTSARSMRLQPFTGTVDELLKSNYPSLVSVAYSPKGGDIYVALLKASSNEFRIDPPLASKSTLSRSEFEAVWRRKALIPWKNYVKIPARVAKGSEGKAISTLQKLLQNAGMTTSESGVFDQKTETALRQYQKAKGLKSTGQPDSMTLLLLYNESQYVLHPTLK